jgi:hypothetical protein
MGSLGTIEAHSGKSGFDIPLVSPVWRLNRLLKNAMSS